MPLETVIAQMLREDGGEITPEAVMARLPSVPELSPEAREQLENRVVRELESHEELVALETGRRYGKLAVIFDGAEFLVTPDAFEIEQGILVPGHRFAPFMAEAIFPSEALLQEAGARRKVPQRGFRANAETLLHYHLFMGAEGLFDFFAAESSDNIKAARESANPELTLSVWDMRAFYRETSFAEGDALLVTVRDFAAGRFSFRLDNGRERSEARRRRFREAFEERLSRVLEDRGEGAPIMEQLRLTLAGSPELLHCPGLSLDELLLHDSPVEIVFDHELSTLVPGGTAEDGEGDGAGKEGIPDGITISAGETGSLEAMLPTLKTALTVVEIDSFMLDCCRNFDYDFNSFYSRAFGETPLEFADGAQEAVFFNALEERFEHWRDHYPREFDEKSGALRAEILDFLMERQELFAEYAGTEAESNSDPAVFRELAEAVVTLGEILKVLNHPEAIPDDFDYEALHEKVDRTLDAGGEAISRFRSMFEGS